MLWKCLQEKDFNTNNNIESLHSLFATKPTTVQEFKQITDRYFQLYTKLTFIFSGYQHKYTLIPKQRRDYLRKKKRIIRQLSKIKSTSHSNTNFPNASYPNTNHSNTNHSNTNYSNACYSKDINSFDSGGVYETDSDNSSCDENKYDIQEQKTPSESKIWKKIQN
jgi:hypothetical protein